MKLQQYIIKNLTLLLMLFTVSAGFLMSGCADEDIIRDSEASEEEENVFILNLPMSLPNALSSRSTTTGDGGSQHGTYPAEKNENILDGFYLFCRAYDEGTRSYVNKFLIKSSEVVDFNTDLNTVTVPVKLTVDQLKSIAGNGKVQFFIAANIDDYLFNTLAYRWNDKGEKEKVNILDSEGLTFDPDIFFIQMYPGTNKKEAWNWMGLFEKDGLKVPIVNKNLCEVSFAGVSLEDLEHYAKKEGSENKTPEELVTALKRALAGIFTSTDVINLERACARVDYADGSPKGDGFYPFHEDNDNHVYFYLKLTRIDPINVSRYSYLYRHTAKGDDSEATYAGGYDISLFEKENGGSTTGYNWVIDADAKYKRDLAANWNIVEADQQDTEKNDFSNHFIAYPKIGDVTSIYGFYPNFLHYTGMEKEIDCLYKLHTSHLYDKDNFNYPVSSKSYYPWRYLPENTLPSEDAMIRGLSSGIRFETSIFYKLSDDPNEALKELTDETASELVEIWNAKKLEDPNFPYEVEFGDSEYDPNAQQVVPTIRLKLGDMEKSDIRCMYQEEPNGNINKIFKLYYFYFFRHNSDNSSAQNRTKPRPMKFGLVRNNIYRVSVTGFDGFPLVFSPKDPDEPNQHYISVDIEVLAWVKHNIEMKW